LISCSPGQDKSDKKGPPFDLENEFAKSIVTAPESDFARKFWRDEREYLLDTTQTLDMLMKDICATEPLEFSNLYSTVDSIAGDEYEKLILLQILKSKGFSTIQWGRGNMTDGPRIVSFILTNNECSCEVDKLYYSTETKGTYRVTERIKCLKSLAQIDTVKILDSLNKVIIGEPFNSQAYYERGSIYFGKRKFQSALSDFDRAIKINPDYAEAYNERANAKFDGQIFNKQQPWAWDDYRKAIELNPKLGKAYFDRGIRMNIIESAITSTWGCEDICKALELGYPKQPKVIVGNCDCNNVRQ